MTTQERRSLRSRMRVLARIVCVGVVVLGLVASACAPKDEIIPIIHVSPGFENRLALRPPTGSPYADAAAATQPPADAGAPSSDAR